MKNEDLDVSYEATLGPATIEVKYTVKGKPAVFMAEVDNLSLQHLVPERKPFYYSDRFALPEPTTYRFEWTPDRFKAPHYTVKVEQMNDVEKEALKDAAVKARADVRRAKEQLEEYNQAKVQYEKRVAKAEAKYEALRQYDDGSPVRGDNW